MRRLEEIEAAIRRDRAECESTEATQAAARESKCKIDDSWASVTGFNSRSCDTTGTEFYADWARRFIALGTALVENCSDLLLNELRPDQQNKALANRQAYAIEILKLACDPANQEKVAGLLQRIGDELPELHNLRDDLRFVKVALENHEREHGLPWTPAMSVAELARDLDGFVSEKTIRRKIDARDWELRRESARLASYRSRDPENQREILRRIRAAESRRTADGQKNSQVGHLDKLNTCDAVDAQN